MENRQYDGRGVHYMSLYEKKCYRDIDIVCNAAVRD